MTDASFILAAEDPARIVKILVGILVVVLFVAGKIADAAKKRRSEEETARRAAERRTGVESATGSSAAQKAPTPQRSPELYSRRPIRRATPMQPARVLPHVLEPITPPPIPRIPPRRIAPPRTIVEEHVRTVRDYEDLDKVDEEVERMQQGIEQKLATRHQRMETAAPSEADTAAIDARISHFQRMEVQPDQVARVQVDLNNPRALRAAIIYHEIMSQPKALRQAPELWDL